MKKLYWPYYILMVFLNMLTFLPLSIKGVMGPIFIVISCVKLSYKDGFLTALLWILFGIVNFVLGINNDYKYGIAVMCLGTVLYLSIAYFLGSSIEKLRKKNHELEQEIQRRIEIEKELSEKLKLREESMLLKKKLDESNLAMDSIIKSEKLKTEFFANISHELRTPLNVILGSVQLLNMYARNNSFNECQGKVARNIAIMKQNCYRLLRLVNNLIDITKIDDSSFELQLKNHNIVNIVEEITLSVSDYIDNKGIRLEFDTDVEEKIMSCDAEKVERIMLNLLSNAVKYTRQGGIITVNIHDKGDSICIKVKDSGIGIPKDKQEKIFQRFCQVDNILSRQHEGSGIGLSLVKSIVEMHGGTIGFESEYESGTVFSIDLPAAAMVENEQPPIPAQKNGHVERIQVEFSDIYSIC